MTSILLRTPISIIKLRFDHQFELLQPRKGFEHTWLSFLKSVTNAPCWEWTLWGCDLSDSNSVFLLIGWGDSKLGKMAHDQGWTGQAESSATGLTIQSLEELGVENYLAPISAYFEAAPQVHHMFTFGGLSCLPEGIPVADILYIRTPLAGSLHDAAECLTEKVFQRCRSISTYFWNGSFQAQQRGDILSSLFGVDSRDQKGSTFISIIFWKSLNGMKCFKDPKQPSKASRNRELDRKWWRNEIEKPLKDFHYAGAHLNLSTARLYAWSQIGHSWPPEIEDSTEALGKKSTYWTQCCSI